jgi:eukaryotic-like serine/threonine-protein kinase
MSDRVGQQIGNYRLVRLLGRGSFAEVYLGEHIYLQNQAAIKVLHTRLVIEDVDNFRKEAQIVASLVHPHIIRVLDFDVVEGTPFLVLDFAPHGSLHLHYPRSTVSPLSVVHIFVRQVADALQYAHEHKIIHRDIKPENMLLGRRREVLLSDFGIALMSQSSRTHNIEQVAGTAAYMAPEQFQGKTQRASDQYALGIVIYEWLCGDRPFHGSFSEMASQHLLAPPPPLRQRVPAIPPAVEEVVLTMLAKDPANRFASMLAFMNAWEQAVLSEPFVPTYISSQPAFSDSTVIAQPMQPAQPAKPGQTGENQLVSLPSQDQVPVIAPAVAPLSTDPIVKANADSLPSAPAPTPVPFRPVLPPGAGAQRQARRYGIWAIPLLVLLLSATLITVFIYGPWNKPPPHQVHLVGIAVSAAPDGEMIGISDGTFAFDISRTDGTLKQQAAAALKKRDSRGAIVLWQAALQQETNDAEALIYLEDQRVLASHAPYITFVIGTTLTGKFVSYGRDSLQGAYVVQKEYNDGGQLPGGVKIRLLIANSGGTDSGNYVAPVARQITELAQLDKSVIGVMGWPFSTDSRDAAPILGAAYIPVVSSSSYFDLLAHISAYFFHVAPSNQRQVAAGTQYVEQSLHARRAALFVDTADTYSREIASDFEQQFTNDGYTIVATKNYHVGQPGKLPQLLQDALTYNPDLIYFAGYAEDAGTLLAALPRSGPFAYLQMFGANRLYGSYPAGAQANFARLHFTGLVSAGSWEFLHLTAKKPAFFTDYAQDFDPNKQHHGDPAGYTLADNDTMFAYDAMLVLATASRRPALALINGQKGALLANDLEQSLTKITGSQAIQGVTGQISFGADGTPANKAVPVLKVDPNGDISLDSVLGPFLVG